ncbi:MAG: c-type cytochrome [Gemmatimonadetes bacterium]|nr:c-type cytochrome [Gemmatimonadota bacterium]
MSRVSLATSLLMVLAASEALAQETYRPPTPLGLDEYFAIPEENPLTQQKVALGKRLFFDPLVSSDRSRACASCHRPSLAFSDSVPVSAGVGGSQETRNTPSILNRAYGQSLFWDGRAPSLEGAVLQPIQGPREMNLPLPELLARLAADSGYRREFSGAFAEGPTGSSLAQALASYVRSLRAGNAPVDRYLFGDSTALTGEARAGMRLFAGKANCIACHAGPNFTDERFHNTGVTWGSADLGRYGVTGREEDKGKFKTPSLRNVALTAPYMHDGTLATLEQVVDFYDRGAGPNPHLDEEIKPLNLTPQERHRLLAFLGSLTGEIPRD